MGICIDVLLEDEVCDLIVQVKECFGCIDVLYNNVVVFDGEQCQCDCDLVNLDMVVFDWVIVVNLCGVVLCIKYVILLMLEQGCGLIIFVIFGFGVQGDMLFFGYVIFKVVLLMLFKLVVVQYGKYGICGNVVQIGLVFQYLLLEVLLDIMFDNYCMLVFGILWQIVDVVVFLVSDEFVFVIGSMLVVDGGFGSYIFLLVVVCKLFEQMGCNSM